MSVIPLATGRAAGGRFAKGRSGNPAGRPKGARNRQSLIEEQLLDAGPDLLETAIRRALDGDQPMLRALIGRALPRAPEPTIALDLPEGAEADDDAVFAVLVRAVADGAISPGEGLRLGRLVALRARVAERKLRLELALRQAAAGGTRPTGAAGKPRPVSGLYSSTRASGRAAPTRTESPLPDSAPRAGKGEGQPVSGLYSSAGRSGGGAAVDRPLPDRRPVSGLYSSAGRSGRAAAAGRPLPDQAPVFDLYFSRAALCASTALARPEFRPARLRAAPAAAI
jgi:hypothetical protein